MHWIRAAKNALIAEIIAKAAELAVGAPFWGVWFAVIIILAVGETICDLDDKRSIKIRIKSIRIKRRGAGGKIMKIEPEILEHHGTISTNERNGWKREVNLVSWGGDPEKYDIRDWAPDHERSGKCGTFTAEELRNLRDILNQMDLEKE